nr:MAG: hypothetical protein 1 [Leviviridae sp.]
MKTRKASKSQQVGHYKTQPNNPPPIVISSEDSTMWAGDWGNYGWPNFPKDPIMDVGGKFFLNHFSRYRSVVELGTIRSGTSRYIGGLAGSFPAVAGMTGSSWSPSVADTQAAYNRMKPTKPEFEALNALYELKDIPFLLRQRLSESGLKNVGSYYLALEFGWKPLLRDIRKFVHAQHVAEIRLQQLLRDNGIPVRRRINVRSSSDTVHTSGQSYAALAPTLTTGFYQGVTPSWSDTITTSERIWASAQFRYWLPEGPRDVSWKSQMKRRILGFDTPSPKNVWDAMPWTWLSDWFIDVGAMLETLDIGIADRLAADYLYIMRELTIQGTRESIGYFRHEAGDYFNASAIGSATAKLLCRDKGTPFGWNVNESSLSSHQWSILGALGLSRLL